MKNELNIGRCGLVCAFCSENSHCKGCHENDCKDKEWCENYQCSQNKKLDYCYQCNNPCHKGLLSKVKVQGFNLYIKKYGKEALIEALEENEKHHIIYHKDGINGDYDEFEDPNDVVEYLETHVNPVVLRDFWQSFLKEKGLDKNTKYYSCYHFEITERVANELLDLVLQGIKKATSSNYAEFIKDNERLPQKGDYNILIDWDGNPKCVIQNTNVSFIPYKDMTFDIVKKEGEDENLASWQNNHLRFFKEDALLGGYEFTEDSLVVFEEFEVVYKKDK